MSSIADDICRESFLESRKDRECNDECSGAECYATNGYPGNE